MEQYQAKLLVLASELEFIDFMQLVPNPVGVTPQQLLAQFKSGCENAMWRRECRSCKTLDEAVALVKDILAAEYSATDILGTNVRPTQINAIEEEHIEINAVEQREQVGSRQRIVNQSPVVQQMFKTVEPRAQKPVPQWMVAAQAAIGKPIDRDAVKREVPCMNLWMVLC